MREVHYSGSGTYIIKVRSHVDARQSYWFEGMTITSGYDEDGRPITALTGHLADQAALHGVLTKIGDLNLVLISVSQAAPDMNDVS